MLIVFLFCLPLLPKFFLQESIPTAEPVSTESSSAGSATVSQLEEAEPAPEPEPQPLVQTVRFSATGDNLIHSPIYKQAKRRAAGTEGYSFDYCYEHIAPFYVQQDVNWINQETLCTDELERQMCIRDSIHLPVLFHSGRLRPCALPGGCAGVQPVQ